MADLNLRVTRVEAEARDVLRLELANPHGRELPAWEPGAHLVVHLPGGLVRHYSLAGDWRERHRYVLGVGRATGGRGGSDYVHGLLRQGMDLRCSEPVNNFRLVPGADRYLFIAGGIGITPIIAMVRWCVALGKPWRLAYAVRSRQRLAFYEELREYAGRVHFHCDDEAGGPLDMAALMADIEPGTEVYCCGPAPLMNAVQELGAGLPADALHFEWFSAPAANPDEAEQPAEGFEVQLQRSGRRFHVPPDQSILEVLEQNGIDHPYSCREGLCGTCETTVCEGELDHRDYVYSEAQREGQRTMMICVSRAKSPRLVLDL